MARQMLMILLLLSGIAVGALSPEEVSAQQSAVQPQPAAQAQPAVAPAPAAPIVRYANSWYLGFGFDVHATQHTLTTSNGSWNEQWWRASIGSMLFQFGNMRVYIPEEKQKGLRVAFGFDIFYFADITNVEDFDSLVVKNRVHFKLALNFGIPLGSRGVLYAQAAGSFRLLRFADLANDRNAQDFYMGFQPGIGLRFALGSEQNSGFYLDILGYFLWDGALGGDIVDGGTGNSTSKAYNIGFGGTVNLGLRFG